MTQRLILPPRTALPDIRLDRMRARTALGGIVLALIVLSATRQRPEDIAPVVFVPTFGVLVFLGWAAPLWSTLGILTWLRNAQWVTVERASRYRRALIALQVGVLPFVAFTSYRARVF